ncbi:serine hydrolase [Ideonella sp. A 288]|uniref:serine hydrolase domain-containing protein n=1 Tax=Ideonella sp. A 288 TaxID=1962181 RepID=UPI000B4B25CE|nr:serine hydrolase domain-containing protein [Ideonella sp. A 288]
MPRNFAAALALSVLLAACASAPPRPEPVPRDDLDGVQRQLGTYIAHELAQQSLAGLSIALVDDQRIVWASGFGWADASAQVPATPQTRYRVGSISKLFTDTAAMQLVAQGALDLDAPVQRTLPWFRIGSAWPQAGDITLRQLMTHHAGLPRDMAGGMWLQEAPSPSHDFRAMLHSLADSQVDAPPGQMLMYSNVGLDLVGAMIEAGSGEPFEQRLHRTVFTPLGLRNAQFSAAVPDVDGMARGHYQGKPQREPALRDVPAGGLNASVTDLGRFLMMQFANGRNAVGEVVLPAEQQAAMLERQNADVPLDADMRIGLGWMLTTFGTDTVRGGGPVAHHGGATMYFRSQLMMLPQHKIGVVVASNDGAAGNSVNRIAQRALALLLEARTGIRQTVHVPGFTPAARAWPPEQWLAVRTTCAGDYMTLAGPVSLVPDGQHMIALAGGRRLELLEGEAGRFGLRYRLAGLLPIELGTLSKMGFECRQVQGRQVLIAVLDDERIVAGEKLPPASLPSYVARWTGSYKPRLAEGETASLSTANEVRVFQSEGRLWVQYKMHRAFGGGAQVALLQPISQTAARAVGPLADVGAMVQIEDRNGETPRVRFSGWTFDRVGD